MKILIVDDAVFLRTTLKHILEKNQHSVVGEAEDGLDAIQKYKELQPDVVTMDITMPHMNGLEALKEILKIDPNAQVLVCSAMGRNDFITEAIKAGAKGFITKPFREDSILQELTRLSTQ